MASASHVLTGSAILHGQDGLCNHFTRIGADNMRAKDPIGLAVTKDLYKSVRILDRLGTAIGQEGKGADRVGPALSPQLLFRQPTPGHLGMGVDDRWDGVVVYMTVALGDEFDRCDSLLFGLVSEHGAGCDISDGSDRWDVGLEVFVHANPSTFVKGHADFLKENK